MANWMQRNFLDNMEEGLGDEVDPVDVAERARMLSKEKDYPMKLLEGSSVLESREVVIPDGEDMLENNDVNRSFRLGDASDQPCASPRFMDDGGNMVEELMVRDYDSKLAIVGTSNNRERIQNRQTQWQHLYQHGGAIHSGWEDPSFNELMGQSALITGKQEDGGLLLNEKNIEDSRQAISHQGIRTKILSKTGFPEFFIKNTLKGKGIIFRGLPHEGVKPEPRDELSGRAAIGTSASLDDSLPAPKVVMPSPVGTAPQMMHDGSDNDGRSLREWLSAGKHKASKDECLHIFRQVVELLECSHSQGIALRDLRPSCFKLLQSNLVKYHAPPANKKTREVTRDGDAFFSGSSLIRRRPVHQGLFRTGAPAAKKQKFTEDVNASRRWPQFTAKYSFTSHADSNLASSKGSPNGHDLHTPAEDGNQVSSSLWLSNTAQQQMTSVAEQSEERWYLSPEELAGGVTTMSSNIYSLGVLLFELLGRFDTEKSRATAMSDLRHRILPPNFLSEHSKEVGYCLLLLHPEPSSRPTTRDILQSELIGKSHEVSAEELSSSIEQDDAESDLLMHFLSTLGKNKQERAAELIEDVRCLEKDIEEVVRRRVLKEPVAPIGVPCGFLEPSKSTSEHKTLITSDVLARVSSSSNMEGRFLSNIDQLERAYFTTRSKIQHPGPVGTVRDDKDLLRNRDARPDSDNGGASTDCLGAFFDGLCKYARYTKFEVRGMLRTGEFNNSANVICSLSFDRDGDYFAAAGISKKIKIYEFNALFNGSVDIHYPAIEMSNKSKLSCICWNNYIKNYLASTGYDGVVKLWDVSTGQGISQFSEHEKRAWSVDFSPVYPTKFASGSDDCSVKLWNINEKNSLGTIRNIANVCCVQFSPYSTHLLAFGSADYKTYCYDLRNIRTPWCVLAGHEKAVSYVKFLDPETIVTASTDNSLKLWDLNKTSSTGVSSAACSSTLRGHTNEKNFVGLSVANGYVTCGSETNEVYSYYRSLPMPIISHKFGSIDPISGKETDDDNGLFVSSVCWKKDTDMLVAANSSGCIKALQMV